MLAALELEFPLPHDAVHQLHLGIEALVPGSDA